MRKFLGTVFIVVIVCFFAGCFMFMGKFVDEVAPQDNLSEKSILQMELSGVIIEPKKFLEDLRKYAAEEKIRGVLLVVNSPGGVVGPSQEIYAEIKRVREELKKPVVATCSGLAASGAYYAAVAADQIYTNPGSLLGSIGVIMEFANLEKLYDWAKIQRYVIKTGAYKDSGAEYRPMRDDERALFQELANEVLNQFKNAVSAGRKLSPDVVNKYADGRVFSGETAVRLGFADKVGTYTDALRAIGQLSGLGEKPKVFEPPPERPHISDFFVDVSGKLGFARAAHELLGTKLWGQPLFLLPSAVILPDHK